MDLGQRLTTRRRWAWPLALVGLGYLGAARPARADQCVLDAWLAELRAQGPRPAPAAGPGRRSSLTPAEWAQVQGAFPASLLRLGLNFPGALAAQVQARADVAQLHQAALRVLEHDGQRGAPPATAGIVAALLNPPDAFRRAVAHGASPGAGAEPGVEPPLRIGLTLDWHTPPATGQLPRPRPPGASEGLLVLRSPHDNSDVLWTLPEATQQGLLAAPGRLAGIPEAQLGALLVPFWPGERAEGRLVVWLGLALGPLAWWTQLSEAPLPGRSAPGVRLVEPARLRLSALVASAGGSGRERHVGPSHALALESHDDPRLRGQSPTATRLLGPPASVAPLRPSAEVIRAALTERAAMTLDHRPAPCHQARGVGS